MQVNAEIHVPATSPALDALARACTEIAVEDLRAHPSLPSLYAAAAQGLVRYEEEGTDERGRPLEEWLMPSEVIERGVADCEDLAFYRAGELRLQGVPATARIVPLASKREMFHAIVDLGDGTVEDPTLIVLGFMKLRAQQGAPAMPDPVLARVNQADNGQWCASLGIPWGDGHYCQVSGVGDFADEALDAVSHAAEMIQSSPLAALIPAPAQLAIDGVQSLAHKLRHADDGGDVLPQHQAIADVVRANRTVDQRNGSRAARQLVSQLPFMSDAPSWTKIGKVSGVVGAVDRFGKPIAPEAMNPLTRDHRAATPAGRPHAPPPAPPPGYPDPSQMYGYPDPSQMYGYGYGAPYAPSAPPFGYGYAPPAPPPFYGAMPAYDPYGAYSMFAQGYGYAQAPAAYGYAPGYDPSLPSPLYSNGGTPYYDPNDLAAAFAARGL